MLSFYVTQANDSTSGNIQIIRIHALKSFHASFLAAINVINTFYMEYPFFYSLILIRISCFVFNIQLATVSMPYQLFNNTIRQELGIDPLNPKSYKVFDLAPVIRNIVTRKKSKDDEKILNEFIAFLKNKAKLQQDSIAMSLYR